MERKRLLRLLFILLTSVLLLFFTINDLPYSPSTTTGCHTTGNGPSPGYCTNCHFLEKTTRLHFLDVAHHPLDPLTIREFNKVQCIIKSHVLFKNSVYALHSVVLEEPAKQNVLTWRHGDPLPPRKVSVIARVNGEVHVLTVDLSTGEVIRHKPDHISGYPTMTIEDMTSSTRAPMGNAEFNRSISARGVDLADLACLPLGCGWYGLSELEEKKRLIKIQCYSTKVTPNFPIEGLTVLLDIDTKQVVEIVNPRDYTTFSKNRQLSLLQTGVKE